MSNPTNSPPLLWKHQEAAIERAKYCENFALFFDLGTGKSRTTLEIIRHHFNSQKKILRTMIIGPSAVVFNWRNEISKYTKIPLEKVYPLTGSLDVRVKVMKNAPHDSIFITNYEAFAYPKFVSAVMSGIPEVLILDESHRVKDSKAKRTKNLIKLSYEMEKLPTKHRYILSGTPVLNSEMDIFSQFLILDSGKTFGTNFFAFRATYFRDKNAYMPRQKHFPNFVPKEGTLDKIKAKIAQISAEANKADCLDLPPFVRQSVEVEMSTEQKKAYEDMKKDFIAFVGSGVATAQLALTKALRLQQILSGFITLEDGSHHVFKENPRADALEELIVDIAPNQKTIIWSIFHADYNTIEDILKRNKIEYRTLTGLTKDKQKEIDEFQNDPNVRVIVASQMAGGTGVNLTAASCMIYYSRSYSLEHDMQSEARAHRGGSEIHSSITRIDLLARGTVDEIVLQALREKKNLAESILDLAAFI